DNPEIQQKIRAARLVVVAGEHEKNADVQAKTDAQHAAQAELVKALNPGANVMHWKPESPEFKDVADYNLYLKMRLEQPEQEGITHNVKPRNLEM
ncbi:hypothetical protein ACOKR6_16760, partial [Vibrio cholerae]